MQIYIGLMSGTSMDGIDVALVDVSTHKLIKGITVPYSLNIRPDLKTVLSGAPIEPFRISQLSTRLGREFAGAVNQLLTITNLKSSDVIAIGSHGQTICHDANTDIPYTMQLGCPHTLAELTGINVVADFRTRDLVLGGQGAPFAPAYHQILFGHWAENLSIVNIGGIANLTSFTADKRVSGYDVGPGNCLMDAWIESNLSLPYDKDGSWAVEGCVIETLLLNLLNDPYFKLPLPRSIGKEYFSLEWLANFILPNYRPEDIQATLLELTARTIADSIKNRAVLPKDLAVCGGGVHNHALLSSLRKHLPGINVKSTEFFDVDPDYLEAMLIAWLAYQSCTNTAIDLRDITGSKSPMVLGVKYLVTN